MRTAQDQAPDLDVLITLNEARALLPGRPAINTLWRWRQGKGTGGRKLRTVKIGRTVYTSRRWLFEFLRDGTPAGRRSNRVDRQQRDSAELQAAGI